MIFCKLVDSDTPLLEISNKDETGGVVFNGRPGIVTSLDNFKLYSLLVGISELRFSQLSHKHLLPYLLIVEYH